MSISHRGSMGLADMHRQMSNQINRERITSLVAANRRRSGGDDRPGALPRTGSRGLEARGSRAGLDTSRPGSRVSLGRVYDDEDTEYHPAVKWINIIFLPFHPIVRIIILICVVIKCAVAPVISIYPFVRCISLEIPGVVVYVKFVYRYLVDPIYIADTFLHIIHRQVTDVAEKREFLPKPASLLFIDIISIIPLYKMASSELCPTISVWPNALAYLEFFVIYRVFQYFSLKSTHSPWTFLTGFVLSTLLILNCLGCWIAMVTLSGLCDTCQDKSAAADWRVYLNYYDDVQKTLHTYYHSVSLVVCLLVSKLCANYVANTYKGHIFAFILLIMSYVFNVFVLQPKIYTEFVLTLSRIAKFNERAIKVTANTKRRHFRPDAHKDVEEYFYTLWVKRRGIAQLFSMEKYFPRSLRRDVFLDMYGPIFFHSPTFRNTSMNFKRWLSERIEFNVKIEGEQLYGSTHSYTDLYYIKAGIVQIMTSDDTMSPLLSITAGTLLGDISFYVTPSSRKTIVRCFSYCEFYVIPRKAILEAIHLFTEDRKLIFGLVKHKIDHARNLSNSKEKIRGVNRIEDEGILWVKERWWEIYRMIREERDKDKANEAYDAVYHESAYHCPKYIGQLVLCLDSEVQKKRNFAKRNFPWIIMPNSSLYILWRKIVLVAVYSVIILYPANIVRRKYPTWFILYQIIIDAVYILDVTVSLLTSTDGKLTKVSSIAYDRFYSIGFILDILATPWIDNVANFFRQKQYEKIIKFNRLLKIYLIWTGIPQKHWKEKHHPLNNYFKHILITTLCFGYVVLFFMYVALDSDRFLRNRMFGSKASCNDKIYDNCKSLGEPTALDIILGFCRITILDMPLQGGYKMYYEFLLAINLVNYILYAFKTYLMCKHLAAIYLKNKNICNYHNFVVNMRKHYVQHKIHPDLLKRLNVFLECHWHYFKGMDILQPKSLRYEHRDIYWKFQGTIAEKIIGTSRAFMGANRDMIKDMASKAVFLILPQLSELIVFGVTCRNVNWLVKGVLKCEYLDESGQIMKKYQYAQEMLSPSSIFLGKIALRTYTAASDCEILYLSVEDFFRIIRRYPDEWRYLQQCVKEFGPRYYRVFHDYVKKHKDYQKKLRTRLFHARKSVVVGAGLPVKGNMAEQLAHTTTDYVIKSGLSMDGYVKWMHFRIIIAFIQIINSTQEVGPGYMNPYHPLFESVCEVIAIIDIGLRLFMPYYDKRGLLITDEIKCIRHYIVRGFFLDMLVAFPSGQFLNSFLELQFNQNNVKLLNMVCKTASLYLIYGYCDYMLDLPNGHYVKLIFIKWHFIAFIFTCVAASYYLGQCYHFKWNEKNEFVSFEYINNTCWKPFYVNINSTSEISLKSYQMALSAIFKYPMAFLDFQRSEVQTVLVCLLGLFHWYIASQCRAWYVLSCKGSTSFQLGIRKLLEFLKEERVEPGVINDVVNYFSYCLTRSKGVDVDALMADRMGILFKHDLNHFFYKRTFVAVDALLQGGDKLIRALAVHVEEVYFMENQNVMREMDLVPFVYIVHRGSVVIMKNDVELAVITKGGIFGQLDGDENRPIRVSARALEHTDLLSVNAKDFQEITSETTKAVISGYKESAQDYIVPTNTTPERPQNTIKYILRGNKTIKLPRMKQPADFMKNKWYYRWLYMEYLWITTATVSMSIVMPTLPLEKRYNLLWYLGVLDVLCLLNLISEFYTMELKVKEGKCVYCYIGWRKLLELNLYFDIVSLVVPIVGSITGYWSLHLFRVLRLNAFYLFHKYFCTTFQNKYASTIMKTIFVLLIMHTLSCGWMLVACRAYTHKTFPLGGGRNLSKALNPSEWIRADLRPGGCARSQEKDKDYVVAINPNYDYLIAYFFVILNLFMVDIDLTHDITSAETLYRLLVVCVLSLLNMWISSIALNHFQTKLSEKHEQYSELSDMYTFLSLNDVSHSTLTRMAEYVTLLWNRHKGTSVPGLALRAPLCLREDMFSSLYMHHLEGPLLFRNLPKYFLRQLACRLRRVVLYPGKMLVEEGDIQPYCYFIHEGEVEKWHTDQTGDSRMVTVLGQNTYFGLIHAIMPNVHYHFSYNSRTVVDAVYLAYLNWQDLLNGYPDIKKTVMETIQKTKKELMM